jgi:hypothetical protein
VPKTTPSTVLQGNTGGVSLLIGNYPGYLSGGANVTLSGHTGSAGATVAIHAAAGGTGAGAGIALAAGTQTATTNTVALLNSNGITFGMAGSTAITATVKTDYLTTAQPPGAYLTTARASNDAVGLATAQTAVTWTVNSAGISLNAGAYLTTAANSTHSHGNPTLALTNLTGTTASASNGFTLSLSAAAPGAGIAVAAAPQTGATGTIILSNSNNISFGMAGNLTVTASVNAAVSDHSHGFSAANGSATFRTLSFLDSNGVSWSSAPGGQLWATVATTYAASNHSHGNPTLALTNLSGTTASASNGLTLSLSAAAPGGGAGNTLHAYEPRPWATSTAYSSHPPATTYWQPVQMDENVAFRWVNVVKSISAAFPAGTSSGVAQSFRHGYTHGISLFSRKNTGASSLSLSYITHGSLVMTVSMTHTSTSMGYTVFFNTDSTGGTTSRNTTSNATANIAAYFNGARLARIPFPATTLSAGEYWIAQGHTSSAASTGGTATTVALYSNLHHVPILVMPAHLGSTNATSASLGYLWPTPAGVASVQTTNADMAMSVISANTLNYWYVNLFDF